MRIVINGQTFRASQLAKCMRAIGEANGENISITYEPRHQIGSAVRPINVPGQFLAQTKVVQNGEMVAVSGYGGSPFVALCDLLTRPLVRIDGVKVVK